MPESPSAITGQLPRPRERGRTYAAIDLGSNSFHLLLARFEEGRLLVVDRHKEMVRLGGGLQADGSLSAQAMERALSGLQRLAERIRPLRPAQVRVVGTNTLRIATNSYLFIERAEAVLGVPVNVISGIEEARLTYLGVAMDVSPTAGGRLVIDIGGGSTEMVLGREVPLALESLAMGSVAFSQRFFSGGRITRRAYERAVLAARGEMQEALGRLGKRRWHEAIGSSGTIRAIERILDRGQLTSRHAITLDAIERLADGVIAAGQCAALDFPGLDADRRDVLPGGLAVLHGLFEELAIREMHVSQYALREGVIFDLAQRGQPGDKRIETIARMRDQYHVDRAQVSRVARLASMLHAQVSDQLVTEPELARRLLRWAIDLHELGLGIAHSGYHRHGAYLVAHSDMPGFSRQEQQLLAFLVANHRRKLRPDPTQWRAPDWRLVCVLRIACLLLRRRDAKLAPADIQLQFRGKRCRLAVPAGWLQQHPLTREDLLAERRQLRAIDIELVIGGANGG